MDSQVESLDGCYRSVLVPSLITKKLRITDIRNVNQGRHKFVALSDGSTLCFIFKREFLNTFATQFESQKAKGESINSDRLDWCIRNNVTYIIFGYPDRRLYYITPGEFKKYADENNTYREVEVKDYRQNFNRIDIFTERTASIPLNLLKRWN